MSTEDSMPDEPGAAAELRGLLERARRGEAGCLAGLREALDGRPELWRHAGDLAAHAERAWVGVAAGADLLLAESLARRLAALRAEMAGPAPTPLERLLVDRVALTWLQAAYSDAAAAQARDAPPRLAAFARARQEAAHRGHLAAVAALASLRRVLASAPAVPISRRPPLGVFGGETCRKPS